jgi:SRSO17 transposase
LRNQQGLHHFLGHSTWQAEALKERRLSLILRLLKGRLITLIIDESSDSKKGQLTDYVKHQYLSNLGKIDNGIVVVTVYGLIEGITIPLLFEVYKPRERLKAGDQYQTKTMLAAKIVRKLQQMGFNIGLVLADSLYGESSQTFLRTLEALGLPFVVSIRSNHGVWMPARQRVRRTRWRPFKRIFSNSGSEVRWIREVIFGQRSARRYWEVQTEEEHHSGQERSYVMTRVEGISYQQVGNYYGLRTWVEYGLCQSKSELGWSDFRMTDYQQIEKWWELVMSAYLMVSPHSS